MDYSALFTAHHIAMIHDWLDSLGSIFVRIERPHSGASGDSYTIRSLGELRALLVRETHPEIEVFVFRLPTARDDDLEGLLDVQWIHHNADRVLYVSVKKNRNWYEPFERNPERYKNSLQDWKAA